MKKWIAMLLAVMTAVSLTACAAKSGGQETASNIPDALTILNTVWASYSEDEKLPHTVVDTCHSRSSSVHSQRHGNSWLYT